MALLSERCSDLDVYADTAVVRVRRVSPSASRRVRMFTMTALFALAERLTEQCCLHVVLEATLVH